jgi:hypothetical protein
VIVKYLLDKFYIDLPILTIDLDKEWNKFKWYLLIKSTNIKTNISWILTSDKFVLNILYNENPVKLCLNKRFLWFHNHFKYPTMQKEEHNFPYLQALRLPSH